ncbi:DUF934 domain-containing protein [Martelella sp. HB161492]|uniref:DUF934 domain-containing protein n=1 Tax=Martelella sp. HB161492 TaxID=2720726 RepID=UPI00159270D5|nr:DUF934 domain-containing protein [Martelella sp. HB161492]
MTRIWRQSGFAENDPWVVETDDLKAGEGQRRLVPFEEAVESPLGGNGSFGVIAGPFDDIRLLAPVLDRIEIIALTFPGFGDGRAFSQASLLRDRLGYQGELRAVGDILIDPLVHMLRCGFDSFAVSNPTAIRRLEEGRLPEVTLYYQPASRDAKSEGGYSWRRSL